jgi:hypothetical protein
MSDFGPNAGIEYVERMSGHVADRISDPAVATRVAAEGGRTFSLDLRISIPHLQDFLDSASHVAQIADGTVSWQPGRFRCELLNRHPCYRKDSCRSPRTTRSKGATIRAR